MLNGEVIWQASDSSLSKERHERNNELCSDVVLRATVKAQ